MQTAAALDTSNADTSRRLLVLQIANTTGSAEDLPAISSSDDGSDDAAANNQASCVVQPLSLNRNAYAIPTGRI